MHLKFIFGFIVILILVSIQYTLNKILVLLRKIENKAESKSNNFKNRGE